MKTELKAIASEIWTFVLSHKMDVTIAVTFFVLGMMV